MAKNKNNNKTAQNNQYISEFAEDFNQNNAAGNQAANKRQVNRNNQNQQ